MRRRQRIQVGVFTSDLDLPLGTPATCLGEAVKLQRACETEGCAAAGTWHISTNGLELPYCEQHVLGAVKALTRAGINIDMARRFEPRWFRYTETVKAMEGVVLAFKPEAPLAVDLARLGERFGDEAQHTLPDDMHMTLCYLGTVNTLEGRREELLSAAEDLAGALTPLEVRVDGCTRFTQTGGDHAVVLAANSADLGDARAEMVEALESAGFEVDRKHGFTPHITLAYIPPEVTIAIDSLEDAPDALRFDRLYVLWGDESHAFPLGSKDKKDYTLSRCMRCDKPPEVEVLWADGRGRAWFCQEHYEQWLAEEERDVVAKHQVTDGQVSQRWGTKGRWVTIDDNPVFIEGPGQGRGGLSREIDVRSIPEKNRRHLIIPPEGLHEATTRWGGDRLTILAYNYKDGTLLAGGPGRMHADLIELYGQDQDYDDFAKIIFAAGTENRLLVNVGRTSILRESRNTDEGRARQLDAAFDALETLARAGFPGDTKVIIQLSGSELLEGYLARWIGTPEEVKQGRWVTIDDNPVFIEGPGQGGGGARPEEPVSTGVVMANLETALVYGDLTDEEAAEVRGWVQGYGIPDRHLLHLRSISVAREGRYYDGELVVDPETGLLKPAEGTNLYLRTGGKLRNIAGYYHNGEIVIAPGAVDPANFLHELGHHVTAGNVWDSIRAGDVLHELKRELSNLSTARDNDEPGAADALKALGERIKNCGLRPYSLSSSDEFLADSYVTWWSGDDAMRDRLASLYEDYSGGESVDRSFLIETLGGAPQQSGSGSQKVLKVLAVLEDGDSYEVVLGHE